MAIIIFSHTKLRIHKCCLIKPIKIKLVHNEHFSALNYGHIYAITETANFT